MLTPSQAEAFFKKNPAKEAAKLLKAVEEAIQHLKTKQTQQKGKAPETAYLLQMLKQDQEDLKQDQEDLKQEIRQKSGTEIDKDKRNAIAKRVRKAYTLHSRRKRLFYNPTESSYRKIAPLFGKKAPARTNIKGAIDAERDNLERQAEAAKARAKPKGTTQTQPSASTDDANTEKPEAEQGMMAAFVSYIGSWMPSTPTETPEPKQEATTKSEKKAEDPPQQPSSTSDKLETANAPETPRKKASDFDTAVVKEDNPSQEDDAASDTPEKPKQQGWGEYLYSFVKK